MDTPTPATPESSESKDHYAEITLPQELQQQIDAFLAENSDKRIGILDGKDANGKELLQFYLNHLKEKTTGTSDEKKYAVLDFLLRELTNSNIQNGKAKFNLWSVNFPTVPETMTQLVQNVDRRMDLRDIMDGVMDERIGHLFGDLLLRAGDLDGMLRLFGTRGDEVIYGEPATAFFEFRKALADTLDSVQNVIINVPVFSDRMRQPKLDILHTQLQHLFRDAPDSIRQNIEYKWQKYESGYKTTASQSVVGKLVRLRL